MVQFELRPVPLPILGATNIKVEPVALVEPFPVIGALFGRSFDTESAVLPIAQVDVINTALLAVWAFVKAVPELAEAFEVAIDTPGAFDCSLADCMFCRGQPPRWLQYSFGRL